MLENEEPAIDPPPIARGLFDEIRHKAILDFERAEARAWLDRRDGRAPPLGLVETDEIADVDVADAVTVCEAEPLVAEVFLDSQEPPARLGLQPGVDHRHLP